MGAKDSHIWLAARTMFGRYGFAKTTISDIATEAGVARQTVYNAFNSKDDILRAVVREMGRESLAAVEAEWENLHTLEEKLAAFQRIGPLSWFEEVRAAPDWADILEGVNTIAAAEMAATENEWVALLKKMLNEHLATSGDTLASVQDVAEFFYSASKNSKYGVDQPKEMKKRLAIILVATLALLERAK
ncbi:MAG: hypothetical protein Rhims3KO_35140 [Hyphomicrobiales bacterium]